jgi:hypothetical protein
MHALQVALLRDSSALKSTGVWTFRDVQAELNSVADKQVRSCIRTATKAASVTFIHTRSFICEFMQNCRPSTATFGMQRSLNAPLRASS